MYFYTMFNAILPSFLSKPPCFSDKDAVQSSNTNQENERFHDVVQEAVFFYDAAQDLEKKNGIDDITAIELERKEEKIFIKKHYDLDLVKFFHPEDEDCNNLNVDEPSFFDVSGSNNSIIINYIPYRIIRFMWQSINMALSLQQVVLQESAALHPLL